MKKTKAKLPKPVPAVVGVCWYLAQEWALMKATATDSDLFENTFAEWEDMANREFAIVRMAYPNAMKVYIHAEEFFAWCHLRARMNNAESRSEFVSEKVLTMTRH